MAISGDVFRINQVYELLQEGQWPLEYRKNYYGWFSGSSGQQSTVDRIDFASDTGTASVRGPLSIGRNLFAGTGNENYGWFGGGFNSSLTPNTTVIIDRIDFAADTDTALVRSSLSVGKFRHTATTDNNYGWFVGGANLLSSPLSLIDRIIFSSDTSTATARGLLSSRRYGLSSFENNTYGWFGGGRDSSIPGSFSYIDRMTFTSDTLTTSSRGPLSAGRYQMSGVNNENYGWFGGGTPGQFSTVDRVDFADDTSITSVRGTLSVGKHQHGSVSNNDYGWFVGGVSNPPLISGTSLIDRIDFSADTNTAEVRGTLSYGRRGIDGVSNF